MNIKMDLGKDITSQSDNLVVSEAEEPNVSLMVTNGLSSLPFPENPNLPAQILGERCISGNRELSGLELTVGAEWLERNGSMISLYLKVLQENGLTLPEAPTGNEIFFRQAEIEAGVGVNTLCLTPKDQNEDKLRLRLMVENSLQVLGMERRVLALPLLAPYTWEDLFQDGTAARKHEFAKHENPRQQIYNTRYALKKAIGELGLDMCTPVDETLTTGFEEKIVNIAKSIEVKSKKSAIKFLSEMGWWKNFYVSEVVIRDLPKNINEAIAKLVTRSQLPWNIIAKLADIPGHTFRRWYLGKGSPSGDGLGYLVSLEKLFKLRPGALTSLLSPVNRKKLFCRANFPEFLRENKCLTRKLVPHLPDDFCERPLNEQEQIVHYIQNKIIRNSDPNIKRSQELTNLYYGLTESKNPREGQKKWPERLSKEIKALIKFKTGSRAPIGMKRNKSWRKTTAKMRKGWLALFFGSLALPHNAADVRLCGLGLSDDYLTLGLVVSPNIVDWYIRFKCEKRTQYTEEATVFISFIISLLGENGWVRQTPQLADLLRPITYYEVESEDGVVLLSEELVKRAKQDWDTVCIDAIKRYRQLVKDIKPKIKQSRDPFQPIEGLSELDEPITAIGRLVDSMKAELPDKATRPVKYHTKIRDIALVTAFGLTGLRRGTMCQLTTEHFFSEGGNWHQKISRELFKNPESPFFGPPNKKVDYFENQLPDVYGSNDIFNEYMEESRPFIMNRFHPNSTEQPLFPSTNYKGATALQADLMSGIYRKAFSNHLVHNEYKGTGIENVRATGPNASRHLRGQTAMKKTGGNYQAAGDVNQNSPDMAKKHYTNYNTKDRNRSSNKLLFGKHVE
jgi:hypothetical protein